MFLLSFLTSRLHSSLTRLVSVYKAPDAGTFISQIRLAEFLGPSQAVVQHDDPTDLTSPADTCFISPVANYAPGGSVNLSLRLNFAAPGHKIWIGAVGVHVQ